MKQWIVLGTIMGFVSLVGCGGQDGKNGTDGIDGMNGTSGSNGTPGANGIDGTNGEAGATSRVAVVAEPAGANCPNGGQKIETGIDKNENGVLDPSEIVSTSYVCNGDAGAPGAPGDAGAAGQGKSSLIRTSHELAGANCAYGGVRIETGVDANGDGVLQDSEVNASETQFVCQTAPAYRQLDALPQVTTVHGFALTASTDDGSPRLGYMFTDADYQQALLTAGSITEPRRQLQRREHVRDVPVERLDVAGVRGPPDAADLRVFRAGRRRQRFVLHHELSVVRRAGLGDPQRGQGRLCADAGLHDAQGAQRRGAARERHALRARGPGGDAGVDLLELSDRGLRAALGPLDQPATLDSAASTVSYPQLLVAGTERRRHLCAGDECSRPRDVVAVDGRRGDRRPGRSADAPARCSPTAPGTGRTSTSPASTRNTT